jgi:hypothetical protein
MLKSVCARYVIGRITNRAIVQKGARMNVMAWNSLRKGQNT